MSRPTLTESPARGGRDHDRTHALVRGREHPRRLPRRNDRHDCARAGRLVPLRGAERPPRTRQGAVPLRGAWRERERSSEPSTIRFCWSEHRTFLAALSRRPCASSPGSRSAGRGAEIVLSDARDVQGERCVRVRNTGVAVTSRWSCGGVGERVRIAPSTKKAGALVEIGGGRRAGRKSGYVYLSGWAAPPVASLGAPLPGLPDPADPTT